MYDFPKASGGNWQVGTIDDDYEVQAKVGDNPSPNTGIDGGRVFKLHIRQNGREIFNYDREEDFDNAPKGLVDRILLKIV